MIPYDLGVADPCGELAYCDRRKAAGCYDLRTRDLRAEAIATEDGGTLLAVMFAAYPVQRIGPAKINTLTN